MFVLFGVKGCGNFGVGALNQCFPTKRWMIPARPLQVVHPKYMSNFSEDRFQKMNRHQP